MENNDRASKPNCTSKEQAKDLGTKILQADLEAIAQENQAEKGVQAANNDRVVVGYDENDNPQTVNFNTDCKHVFGKADGFTAQEELKRVIAFGVTSREQAERFYRYEMKRKTEKLIDQHFIALVEYEVASTWWLALVPGNWLLTKATDYLIRHTRKKYDRYRALAKIATKTEE